jgi:hypothetical protein
MTDSDSLDRIDPADAVGTTARDPDRGSTWNTIDGSIDIDEVLDEDDLENFFVEQIPDPLDLNAPPDDAE